MIYRKLRVPRASSKLPIALEECFPSASSPRSGTGTFFQSRDRNKRKNGLDRPSRVGSFPFDERRRGVKVEFSGVEVLIFPRDDRRTAQTGQVNFFLQAFFLSLYPVRLRWRDESFSTLACYGPRNLFLIRLQTSRLILSP